MAPLRLPQVERLEHCIHVQGHLEYSADEGAQAFDGRAGRCGRVSCEAGGFGGQGYQGCVEAACSRRFGGSAASVGGGEESG